MSAAYFQQCPKCEHAPLPRDQALPAACPSCGVILAKLASYEKADDAAPAIAAAAASAGDDSTFKRRLVALLLYVPPRTDPFSFWCRAILLALFAVWGLRLIVLDYETGEMMSSFLHGPLLVFHEAGHVIFSFFGEFIMVFGGSFAQLLMPAIMAGALLLKNRDPFGAAIGTWLVGVSLLDLAPYVYDALQPELILLGGHTGAEGGHDWIYLLSATGLLQSAHVLGWLVHKSGALMILASLAWAVWILLQQKRRGLAAAS
jgi:hypothetical protein